MKKYILRASGSFIMAGNGPLIENNATFYLYKTVNRNRQGHLVTKYTQDPTHARAWSTRKGINGYLLNNLTYAGRSSFVVEEMEAS